MNRSMTTPRYFEQNSESSQYGKDPFVCLFAPSIGYNHSHNTPFVCHNSPSVCLRRRISHFAGFSLIELMIVLAVLGIMAAWAAPNLMKVMDKSTVTTIANTLVADLGLARSEAIKRRVSIGVCKSIDGLNCAPAASWKNGWIIWADRNGNNIQDAADEILRVREQNTNPRLVFAGNGNNSFLFTPSGMTTLGAAVANISICYEAAIGRNVEVSLTGNAKVGKRPVGC